MTARFPDPPTRPTLLQRVKNLKDEGAWEEFRKIYGVSIYDYILSQVGREEDADDVMQDVMKRLVQSLPTFEYRPQEGRFCHYLVKLTHSQLCRFWKKKRRTDREKGGPQVDFLLDNEPSPEQVTQFTDRVIHRIREAVFAAVRPEFEDRTWEAYDRVKQQNRPARQVADELGMKTGAVHTACHRVRKRLQEKALEFADDSVLSLL